MSAGATTTLRQLRATGALLRAKGYKGIKPTAGWSSGCAVPKNTFDDESRSTWTQKAHANAALMKPVVAKPTVEEEDENEGPLSKNKARGCASNCCNREDELTGTECGPCGAAGDAARRG